MSIISDQSPVIEKTKELCQLITENSEYKTLIATVESFLSNDEARMLYQSVHERSEELRDKQRAGVELADSEVEAFKEVRAQMESNDTVMGFLAAQDELQLVQSSISKYIGMTLELGRVPSEEDFAAADGGGCCGGGGGEEAAGGGG